MTTIAHHKPDFSGEWHLNREASTLSPIVAPVVEGGVLKIAHHEPTFNCQMTIVMDGKPFDTKYELLTDGHELGGTESGARISSCLRWDGDALVAAWQIETPNGDMTIVFRYELQDTGRRLRASEQLRGGGRDQDNVWMFDRS